MSNIDSGRYVGNSQNIDTLTIEINEASLNSDEDLEELAARVGNEFVKELSKQGFATANYSF